MINFRGKIEIEKLKLTIRAQIFMQFHIFIGLASFVKYYNEYFGLAWIYSFISPFSSPLCS